MNSDLFKMAVESQGPGLLEPVELDWDLQTPCGDCPFRKSSPFHQGVAKGLPLYLEAIDRGKLAHTCHKTDNREECDGPRNWKGDRPKHCAGLILMLLKTGDGKDLQLPLLQAAEAGKLDLARMIELAADSQDIFTLKEMLAFYLKEIQELAGISEFGSES